MKIVVFSENRENYWSGGRWYPHFIAHALASKGHQVKISTNIIPIFDKYFQKFPGRENIEIIEDRKNKFGLTKTGLNTHFRGPTDLTIGSPINGALWAATFAEIKRCKCMVLCYEPNNWVKEKSGRTDILLPGQNWTNYIQGAERCHKFLCNAVLPAEYAKKWIPSIADRVDYLYNGFNSIEANKVGIVKERDNQIVFLSRGYKSKGFTDIAEYFGKIKNKPKVIFITGAIDKEDENRLIDDCKKAGIALEIKKLINDNEKFEIIAKSKALFFPSRWEGFGIPPAEAFYMKTPVICYNLPVLKEIYKDYPHYMKLGKPKYNQKLIEKLFSKDKLLFKNISKAKEHVASFGTFENFASAINEKIQELMISESKDISMKREKQPIQQPKRKAAEYSKSNRKPRFKSDTKISVIIPFYNGNLNYLAQCVQSLDRQTHRNFEVIFIDDGCTDNKCKQVVEAIAKVGEWKIVKHEKNKGIAQSITDGVEKATGKVITFLDADDTLRDRALEMVAMAFDQNKDLGFVYTNEVQINGNDDIIFEEKKPDWSLECLYTGQYINHLIAYRADFLKWLMPCRKEYGSSWDYDLLLRAAERDPKVTHIPKVLYNWRIHESQAGGMGRQYSAQANAITALNHHLGRIKVRDKKEIIQTPVLGYFDSKHSLNGKNPKILIITMTRNVHYLGQLIISMEKNTNIEYDHLIAHHEPQGNWDKDLLEYFRHKDMWFELVDGPFNFSKTHNEMVEKHGKGYDYYVLANDDLIVNRNWLTELIAMFHYKWKKVGIVGCRLMYPNHDDLRHVRLPTFWYENVAKIQHAGVCLLKDRGAAHCYVNQPSNLRAANYARPFETVTFGLVAIDANCYKQTKLNPKYDSDLNDIDFCIRAKRKGWEIIYTPWANAIHLCSVTRKKYGVAGKVINQQIFRKEYKNLIKNKMTYQQMLKAEQEGL